ncbi:MAG: glycosyltransferase [bacterium]
MRIAMLSPIGWRTPPRYYGPVETIVSLLTEGLTARGFDVTLFATAESETQGKLHAICGKGYEEDKEMYATVWECLHISELFERADEFELIHNHFDFLPLTYSDLVKTPIISTIHGLPLPKVLPVYKKYNGKVFYVSISDADRASELDYIATIHYGIDVKNFDFNPSPDNYLLFWGRINQENGVKVAIEIARASAKKLIIAGIIQDEKYYEKYIQPYIDNNNVTFEGAVDSSKSNKLLRNAYAFLAPQNCNEPSGLSVIESMACGTPVIGFNQGSMPELLKEGENGFLVHNMDEAIKAVNRVKDIDRFLCRKIVEERFTVDCMIEKYIKEYETIISKKNSENHRPWGYYCVLSDEDTYKAKKIVVFPGKRLSLQRHQKRSEHWHILDGKARMTLDNEQFTLVTGESVDIPKHSLHRIENIGTDELSFIEIQTGDYFGEDDIERVEDDFGRI